MRITKMELAIIDADSIAFAITAAMDKDTQGYPEQVYTVDDISASVSNWLALIEEETECKDYKMYLTGRSSFRKQIMPEYKANRDGLYRPPMLSDAKRVMVEEFGAEFAEDGYEADDEVGQIGLDYWIEGVEDNCVICSIDKDLDTIPGWHYRWPTFNKEGALYFVTEEEAMHSYWKQVLSGDSGDGVKGLPKIGPKKAEVFLHGCVDEEGYFDACEQAYHDTLRGTMPESDIIDYFRITAEVLRIGKENRDHVYSSIGSDSGDC